MTHASFIGGVSFLIEELQRGASVGSVQEKARVVFGNEYCDDLLHLYTEKDALLNHLECHVDAIEHQWKDEFATKAGWTPTPWQQK